MIMCECAKANIEVVLRPVVTIETAFRPTFVTQVADDRPVISVERTHTYGVEIDYSQWRGVFIRDVDGALYEVQDWSKESGAADGVVVLTDDASLIIATENAHASAVTWGSKVNVSGVTNADSAAAAKLDFDGEAQTTAIIENASSSPAATYCRNYRFPSGIIGYLAAGGEWDVVIQHKDEIIEALKACGGEQISGIYWTSTEQTGTQRAWYVKWSDGSFANYNKGSKCNIRAFGRVVFKVVSKLKSDSEQVSISVVSINRPMAAAKHVCSYGQNALLVVSPKTMWLDENNDFTATFDVMSNVNWTIE